MKKNFLLFFFLTVLLLPATAQVFQVDTLQWEGDPSRFINLVVMGDGYTNAEQTTFTSDAISLTNYLFSQEPWAHYRNYFNVFAIHVISAQSGVMHPGIAPDCPSTTTQPVSNPTTYFGCTFDYGSIHRLVAPTNWAAVANVLATNFPNYDQALIVVNSPYYGGSGGAYATSTTNTNAQEVTAHELGHSFAGLADEYYAGDGYAAERPNMTQETDSSLVKWTNWIGTNNTGIFQHCCGGQSASWYRPHQDCKMRYLGVPYCSVCQESLTEHIHTLTNPIVDYSPTTLTVSSPASTLPFKLTQLMLPIPNSLSIGWQLDGTAIGNGSDSLEINQSSLSSGLHTLTATVVDTTALVRTNNHATLHFNTVTWSITKTTTGISTHTAENAISCSVYPNPATSAITLSVHSESSATISATLYSTDGRLITTLLPPQAQIRDVQYCADVTAIPTGNYVIRYSIGSGFITQEVSIQH